MKQVPLFLVGNKDNGAGKISRARPKKVFNFCIRYFLLSGNIEI